MSIQKKKAKEEEFKLSGTGIGETENFLNQENHIFINKLNYICKNYDQSFNDVSSHPLHFPSPQEPLHQREIQLPHYRYFPHRPISDNLHGL